MSKELTQECFNSLRPSLEDYERQREHMIALEHTRADLMSQNEELAAKCGALERGQEVLLELNNAYEEALQLILMRREGFEEDNWRIFEIADEALKKRSQPTLPLRTSPPAQDHSI